MGRGIRWPSPVWWALLSPTVGWAQPDFIVEAVSTPADVVAPDPVDVTVTIRNIGSASLGPSQTATVSVYANDTADYDVTADRLCFLDVPPSLGPGLATTLHASCDAQGVSHSYPPAGPWWLVARVFTTPSDAQSNTLNDSAASPTLFQILGTAGPDLEVELTGAPLVAQQGEAIVVPYLVTNSGPAADGAHQLELFLSADTSRDASDLVVCTASQSEVGASASTSGAFSACLIPATTTPGAWWLMGEVDADQDVVEDDETNNLSSPLGLTVLETVVVEPPVEPPASGPDLEITAMEVPGTVSAGERLRIDYTLSNLGSESAPPQRTRAWWSGDGLYDDDDTPLCSDTVGGITPGVEISRVMTDCEVPSWADGDPWVLLVTDADGEVVETNEENNLETRPVTVEAEGDADPRDSGAPPLIDDHFDTLGCGCTTGSGGGPWLLLLLLVRRRS